MNIVAIFLIAISLTFDTFAVSVSSGISDEKIRFWQAVKIAIIFAVIQASMPLIGWLIGMQISNHFSRLNHIIAFVLLFIIGAKMIYESSKDEDKKSFNLSSFGIIISLGIATSIDALIVGFSFAFVKINIFLSVFIIGFLTFLVAMLGMLIGKKASKIIGNKAEIIGGIILILIGLRILLKI